MRGAIQMSTAFLLLLLLAAAYLGWLFIPPWLDNFSAKEALAIACNNARKGDEELKALILRRVNDPSAGTHIEEDADGRHEAPGLGIVAEQITIDRSVDNELTIEVAYAREIAFKPTQNLYYWQLNPSRTCPIGP